jgi:putative hydrolase of the HAD superfamily
LLKLLVFDGDETLWSTMPLYRAAKVKFARLMRRHVGTSCSMALETLERLDRDNVERFGFSARRFPISMAESYIRLAESTGQRPNADVRDRVQALATGIFQQPARRIMGAKRVLSILRASGFGMVLCTKGDDDVQRSRVCQSGVSNFFDRVYVVPQKSKTEFETILGDQHVDPVAACSIGDSVRSDINPALELGMSAVWIQKDSWSFEADCPVTTRRLNVVADLRSLPETIDALQTALGGHTYECSQAGV